MLVLKYCYDMLFIGMFYVEGGFNILFSIWFSELVEKFFKEKIDILKFFILCNFFLFLV